MVNKLCMCNKRGGNQENILAEAREYGGSYYCCVLHLMSSTVIKLASYKIYLVRGKIQLHAILMLDPQSQPCNLLDMLSMLVLVLLKLFMVGTVYVYLKGKKWGSGFAFFPKVYYSLIELGGL
ncbi:hypothetical protein KY284_021688 [Solanum tuberosum]|nr:hypothetical protein KY284_021688 [Solanum tuberosum]